MKKLQNVRGVADVLAMKKIALILALAFPLTAGIALAAVIGLVAGGKDFAIVTNMCAKYGLDPRNAG